jgi:flavin reductase (DIM6/NTAB) family NADH-FMN oxidoreductase RutF
MERRAQCSTHDSYSWLHASLGKIKAERHEPVCVNVRQNRKLNLSMSVTPAEFRKALGSFATGVTVITVDYEGEVHGMTANAFASVSLDPMLVLVCVDHRARTHAQLHAKKRFGVNVLAENQRSISEYYALATQTHQDAERQAGAQFDRTAHGTPVLHGALAYLECRLRTAEDAGDHTIFIAEVEDVVVRDGDPLLFFRGGYRRIGAAASGSSTAPVSGDATEWENSTSRKR